MKYIMIENKGVIEKEALTLLGASTKRDDSSKIGFFGSGNKYAIATFLRLGVPFRIFSGTDEIHVSTEDVDYRGKTFARICINGESTSLTTDMGPQWEEWMAIREWVSNSMDEGESLTLMSTEEVTGKEGYSRFYIGHVPSIKTIIDEWNSLFTFDRRDCLYSSEKGKIFSHTKKDEGLLLFRKGIRVHKGDSRRSIFEYDIPTLPINESRVVDSIYTASFHVARFLASVDDPSIIRKLFRSLSKSKDYFESEIDWKYSSVYELPDSWWQTVHNKDIIVNSVAEYYEDITRKNNYYLVNSNMAFLLNRVYGDALKIYGLSSDGNVFAYKKVEKTKKIDYLLVECVEFLKKAQYEISYPIEVVAFERDHVLGMAQDNTILLSDKVFEKGKKEIVSTIIEENEHLKTSYADCTRPFQNHFINMFISEKEDRFGMYL